MVRCDKYANRQAKHSRGFGQLSCRTVLQASAADYDPVLSGFGRNGIGVSVKSERRCNGI